CCWSGDRDRFDRPLGLYQPSKRRLTWANGAIATAYSAEEPRQLLGLQHDTGWADELAQWSDPEAWDNLRLGPRLGHEPRVAATATPKPTKLIRRLLSEQGVAVTRGTTFENRAQLAETFLAGVIDAAQVGVPLDPERVDGLTRAHSAPSDSSSTSPISSCR